MRRPCGDRRLFGRLANISAYLGPIAVVTVPNIRKRYGWKPAEKIPTTYPRKCPKTRVWEEVVTVFTETFHSTSAQIFQSHKDNARR